MAVESLVRNSGPTQGGGHPFKALRDVTHCLLALSRMTRAIPFCHSSSPAIDHGILSEMCGISDKHTGYGGRHYTVSVDQPLTYSASRTRDGAFRTTTTNNKQQQTFTLKA